MSVAATGLLLGTSLITGAAYPAPFIENNVADSAIVVGAGAAASDMAAAIDLQSSLNNGIISSSTEETTTETTFNGESFPLFTGSSKLYLGDSLNSVRSTITDTELSEVLKDGEFSGNVEADYTQRIEIGSAANLAYTKQPDSGDDDPTIGISMAGAGSSSPVYTSEIRFDKIVDFTDEDSEGEEMVLFGQKFTVGADTDSDELVLYKSSDTVELSVGSGGTTSTTVSVGGAEYIVELISADDDEAVIKVTDTSGESESVELEEGESKNIQGLDVALTRAHVSEALSKEMAEVTVGAEKVVLKDGNKVKVGVDEDSIKGTEVEFEGTVDALRSIKIHVWEADDEEDAILEGKSFMDPVFGTFGITFTGLNIPLMAEGNETVERETISIEPSDDDVMSIEFETHAGNKDVFDWYELGALSNDGDKIHVVEGVDIREDEYVVVGNEDNGYLIKLATLEAEEDVYSDNEIIFTNVFDSDEEFEVTPLSDTTGDVYIGGRKYLVAYNESVVNLDYPDSDTGEIVVYPTIQTSRGAKISFYEPLDGSTLGINLTDVTLIAPDGNGYGGIGMYDVDVGDGNGNVTLTGVDNAGVLMFEEEDDTGVYAPVFVGISGTGDDVGVSMGGMIQHESDDDTYTNVDVYGTLFTLDKSGDGASLEISYPSEQVYSEIYIAEGEASTVTTTTTTTQDTNNVIVVKDNEVDSVKDRNLIVVGGSCINSVAAAILGGNYCGEEFTTATGIEAGSYLTKVVASPYNAEKIAMLVAGYEAADTTHGVDAVKSGVVSTELS